MSSLAINYNQKYSWEDYSQWPEDERWELIDGTVFGAAAPSTRHQDIAMNLSGEFYNFFKNKKCRPFAAPTDVKLSDYDIVQPDLLVVCNKDQIKPTHIEGAPKLVVEILSDSTTLHDRHNKMQLYAKFQVKEYWIVTPFPPLVEVYLLDGTGYRLNQTYTLGEFISSPLFPDLAIQCKTIFDYPFTEDEIKFFEAHEPHLPYNAKSET